MLGEYIPLGQRVKAFAVEYYDGRPVDAQEQTTTVGYKRLLRFPTVRSKQLRVRFLDSRGPLCINAAALYYAPQGTASYEGEKAKYDQKELLR